MYIFSTDHVRYHSQFCNLYPQFSCIFVDIILFFIVHLSLIWLYLSPHNAHFWFWWLLEFSRRNIPWILSNLRYLVVTGKAGVCMYRVMPNMPGVVRVIRTNVGINIGLLFVIRVRIGEFSSFRQSFRAKQFELKQC